MLAPNLLAVPLVRRRQAKAFPFGVPAAETFSLGRRACA